MEGEQGEWHVPSTVPSRQHLLWFLAVDSSLDGIWLHMSNVTFIRSGQSSTACRGFKALKQVVKLHFKLQEREAMLEAYRCLHPSH